MKEFALTLNLRDDPEAIEQYVDYHRRCLARGTGMYQVYRYRKDEYLPSRSTAFHDT